MNLTIGTRVVRGLDVGAGDDVVVLLHPYPLHAGTYEADARALAVEGLRVVAPSARGFGGSSGWGGETPSIDAMADDVVAVLDALDVTRPVTVAGISMGGYVALALARRHPARLSAMLLADTKAEADSPEAQKGRSEAIARVEGGDLAGYLESLLPKQLSEVTRTTKPDVVAAVRALGKDASAVAIVQAMEALRDRPDARAVLPGIRFPVAVACGALDEVTPPSVVRPLAHAVRGATYEEIPGVAHFPNLEAPETFRRLVTELVARAASAPR